MLWQQGSSTADYLTLQLKLTNNWSDLGLRWQAVNAGCKHQCFCSIIIGICSQSSQNMEIYSVLSSWNTCSHKAASQRADDYGPVGSSPQHTGELQRRRKKIIPWWPLCITACSKHIPSSSLWHQISASAFLFHLQTQLLLPSLWTMKKKKRTYQRRHSPSIVSVIDVCSLDLGHCISHGGS